MIKGLTITPPVLGRISIGKVIEKNGKRVPQKDDQFTITSQIQGKDGWVNHPIDEKLRQHSTNGKLRQIPVRMLFNTPELNLRAEYTLFDRQTGRPMCVGNGEMCQRRTNNGIESLACPSPENCPLGQNGNCKLFGRLYVNLDDSDELGAFVFRTTGYNSIRTLMARLSYFNAVSGGLLSCLPLQLIIRGKSTTQSYRTPIYYVDLTLQEGISLKEAVENAQAIFKEQQNSGFDQQALEEIAKQGYVNSGFETQIEEGGEIVEEFYPVDYSLDTQLPPINESWSLEKGLQQSVGVVTN
ncbi:hydrolase or metal-binding protein [Moraxella porci DSM 25326]|uniref:Hydrolase or metal-binding protein n=1 Tax=Moraxella porci DSM 25326 TaxID=573983 RepID=A0A1T0CUW7_9GAMM|nr:hydrolase or metal-binding protein [Moraxella porci]OOS26144.1 hydrolase or metal-binding protein [Moraxella porci DSM 25326]